MSFLQSGNVAIRWYHRLFIKIIKCGPIPRHLAVIMDGNRRYAKMNSLKTEFGHRKGFDNLSSWCRELGIEQVTVYAFSLENFKRSPDELNCLFDLFREKMSQLVKEMYNLNN
ncbi:dehydrodolichyl diphosphate synthase complex subunit DHDDS-like [Octopus sinensis]|uniref:ditrans,polycis-polyprenyl diphosphate synthase [(2E,6E)-farnesyldiphosphate specific] n=1 Tax=Octopus sinensis TaxID=2607531 RepID=A0A6P7TZM7_9MOLL|nr:dehydrodolichyl diphosphate synthase complex subunit DHDDS-like [Octopus sinensis]